MFFTLCHTKLLAKCENDVSVVSDHLNVRDLGKIAQRNLCLKSRVVCPLT